MDSSNYWTVTLFCMQGIHFLQSSLAKTTNDTCAQYIGTVCVHRRYTFLRQHQKRPGLDALIRPTPVGPMRNQHYNPNIGFEPYWPGGDWVFNTSTTDLTESGRMCRDKCSPLYERYGKICGRNKKHETRTFPNYCVMMNVDCFNRYGWYIAHRGECRRELPLMFTHPSSISTPNQAVSNVRVIMAGFTSRYWDLLGYTSPARQFSTLYTGNG